MGISLSTDGLTAYLVKEGMAFQIVSRLSDKSLATYHIAATPTTIVVSPGGRVLADWPGAYVGALQSTVQKFFALKLPGLVKIPTVTE